jgi:hypothetical protein
MKAFHIKPGLLIVTLSMLFFISSKAYPENTLLPQATAISQAESLDSNHPLAMAHQELKQAYADFNKGDMKSVQKDLDAASKWLQDSKISNNIKTMDEVTKLVGEIQTLHKKSINTSDEHEGMLARIWHRSSALVEHEVQHIAKSWKSASIENEIYKHLLDARLYFRFAEHELFISHNPKKTKEALNDTIEYLDKADKIANSNIHEKITVIKKDIQTLENSDINTSEQQNIINALETASASLQKVNQDSAPRIQARLKTLTTQIEDLKNEIGVLGLRQKYDAIMERLHELDSEL